MAALITSTLDSDGLLTATIDMTDRTMNVFSFELMDALDALMDRVEEDAAVRCVVLTSGKSSFLAGADLVMVRGFCREAKTATHERMFDQCGRLGRQFVRLENSAKPWVAAVNGLALGGGLELAMACRERLVSDDRRIQLGLPEIRWGLLPGAGGTQRMPRLIGYEAAMSLLLSGRSLTPAQAVEAGLFKQAFPANDLLAHAQALARSLVGQPYLPSAKFAHLAQADVPAHSEAVAREQASRFGVSAEDLTLYPAYSAIIDSVLLGAHLPLDEATTLEMNQFLRLMFTSVAGRMVRTLFLERLRAERDLTPSAEQACVAIRWQAFSEPNAPWAELLTRLKIDKSTLDALPTDTLEMQDTQGQWHRIHLFTTSHAPAPGQLLPAAWLAPTGAYGRVMELVGTPGPALSLMSALSLRLWILPWLSHSQESQLKRLQGVDLAQQAKQVVQHAAHTPELDLSLMDVALCLADVCPGWTGGPLSWLWDEQATQLPSWSAAEQQAWQTLSDRLQQHFA